MKENINRVILIGVNHAGTSFLKTFRKFDQTTEVLAYDKNDNISFLGCGIALWVDGTVKDPESLFYANLKLLTDLNIKVNMGHEVTEIDEINKTVTVKNLETGAFSTEKYSKLVYAGGSWPIVPKLENGNLKNIEICKIYQHAKIMKSYANDANIKNVVVVGAGYIGIELVEAFQKMGKNVTLIDLVGRPVPRYFDSEFTDKLVVDMKNHKVNLSFGERLMKFEAKADGVSVGKVITDKNQYDADLVVLAIGFLPNTNSLKTVEKIANGAIKVNEYMQTSNPDIYAIGDCVAMKYAPTGDYANVALATNAVKTGMVAGYHMTNQRNLKLESIVGTNGINVFDNKLASTGLSEEAALSLKMDVESVLFEDNDRPEFMNDEGKEKVRCKMVYEKSSRRLVGAQIGSYGERNHSEAIFYLALAIEKRMTIDEVAIVDLYFLPHYNKPLNWLLMTATASPTQKN